MAALSRYALSKIFSLELAESIIVCDDRALLVHPINISRFIIFQGFFFFFSCYSIWLQMSVLLVQHSIFSLFFAGPDIRRSTYLMVVKLFLIGQDFCNFNVIHLNSSLWMDIFGDGHFLFGIKNRCISWYDVGSFLY